MSPDFKVMKLTRRGLFLTGAAALLSRSNPAAGPSPSLITLSPSPKDLEMPVEDFIDEITPVGALLRALPHHDSANQTPRVEA